MAAAWKAAGHLNGVPEVRILYYPSLNSLEFGSPAHSGGYPTFRLSAKPAIVERWLRGSDPKVHRLHLNEMKAHLWFQRVLWVPLYGANEIVTLVHKGLVASDKMTVSEFEHFKTRREQSLNRIWSQELDWF
jgi:hypothetical protein